MKKVQFDRFGVPHQVARCVEVPDVGRPAADEIVFEVAAFPINPADLSFMTGSYAVQPALPATPGAECIGRVVEVGAEVRDLAPGDWVINLLRENWAARRRVKAVEAIRVPPGLEPIQAAMLRINPPTAQLLLEDFVELKPGDWVIQNCANSAVGKILIGLAHDRGLRTINVVRRASLASELKLLGADVVVVDEDELPDRVRETTGGAPVRLAIDAVAGTATGRLAGCVEDGGTVVNYGAMSGEECRVPPRTFIYRGVVLAGFMLGRHLARRSRAQVTDIYAGLAGRIADHRISVPVEKVYPIEEIEAALARAEQGERAGKILVTPNPGLLR